MCMIHDAEPAVLLSRGVRKARKTHTCDECGRPISPGESYEVAVTVVDNVLDPYKCCQHCQQAREWLVQECGGWVYGLVEEDLVEHWNERIERRDWEQSKGMVVDMFFDLARLLVGIRRKWTRRNGALMRIPQ